MTAYRITSDGEAAWALARLARARDQVAQVAARGKEASDRTKAWVEQASRSAKRDAEFFAGLLETYHADRIEARCRAAGIDPDNPDKDRWAKFKDKTDRFPTGTLAARRTEGGYDVVDPDAYACWVVTLYPDAAEPVAALDAARLAAYAAAGGDLQVTVVIAGRCPLHDDPRFVPGSDDSDGVLADRPVIHTGTGEVVPGLRWRPPSLSFKATPEIIGEIAAYDPAPPDSDLPDSAPDEHADHIHVDVLPAPS